MFTFVFNFCAAVDHPTAKDYKIFQSTSKQLILKRK